MKPESTSALLQEKIAAGLSKEQALAVIHAQAEHDEANPQDSASEAEPDPAPKSKKAKAEKAKADAEAAANAEAD